MGSCASSPSSTRSTEVTTVVGQQRASNSMPNGITLLFRSGVKPSSTTTTEGSGTRGVGTVRSRSGVETQPTTMQTSSSIEAPVRRHQRPLVGAHFTTTASATSGSLGTRWPSGKRRSNASSMAVNCGPVARRGTTTTAHTFDVPKLMRSSLSGEVSAEGFGAASAPPPLHEEIDASYHASHGDAFDDDSRGSDGGCDVEQPWGGRGDCIWTAVGGGGSAPARNGRAPEVATPSTPCRRSARFRGEPPSDGSTSVTFVEEENT